ncbi:hypothetical protein [Amycolatopsis sp. EV170708-02-1]|uniref:hypothetical protein n=1 Tax=Amycolatopsis sp. EV170708-02-1 TaxID=2919322 RepID=UPI001F0BA22F|nr:hypothetical protein [Amycolatopsis sp. EV170708-02-1]UMP06931.1 hypothetical protein MJQ72_19895 [Amycolatopsis sp. EV170708-02-1]
MRQGIARKPPTELVAERRGPHVLIRRRDETGQDHGFLSGSPSAPEQLFVLATAESRRHPEFSATVCELLRSLPDVLSGVRSVWLGATGLVPGAAVAMARVLALDVCIPDGEFAAVAGAAMYAGHGMGGTGWKRFRAEGPAGHAGTRFPPPAWEFSMPTEPAMVAGAVVQPIPAGVLVSSSEAGKDGFAFGVAVDQRFPKLVVGGTPSPAAVAAVLDRLPSKPFLVVPAAAETASHLWQVELAMLRSRDVMFGTEAGTDLFRPFPAVLRQPAGGGDQEVLDIAPAPPGWVRDGRHSYRFTDGEAEVLADVVPSGLVLRSSESPQPAEPAPFDPACWTMHLGVRGETVGLPVLVAAERLLDVIGPVQRAVVRVRLAGSLDERAKAVFSRTVIPAGAGQPRGTATATGHGTAPEVDVAERREIEAAEQPVAAPVEMRSSPAISIPVIPAIMTMSSTPVPTVSSSPSRSAEPYVPLDDIEQQPEQAVSGDVESVVPPTSEPLGKAEPAPAGNRVVEQRVAETLSEPGQDTQPSVPPVGVQESTSEAAPLSPLVISDRPSSPAEQSRFTTAAGDAFGEALAMVNSALATWPSMRQENTLGVKADYVAVCLFLGRSEGNMASLNGAVRAGRDGPIDGQVPCVVSGIRRLPIHRRAVLRQGKVDESLEHRSAVGTLLTEPGFLTASMDLDVTLPGADLDVLIWPSSARRTSELLMNHPINEAVFLAGARFKALAVRTMEDRDDDATGGEGAAAPKVAVLYRELAPGESPTTDELDARDLAVLAKLDRVLAARQKGGLRLVEDPDAVARLTTSMIEWSERYAQPGSDFRPTLAAS